MVIDLTANGLGEIGAFILIGLMALVTVITRLGGVFLMSHININYRVKQFIAAMSASVLIAIVAPMFISGDHGARVALITTAILQLTIKKPLLAISGGIVMAALTRYFFM